MAAAALRPQSPGARLTLGNALLDSGRPAEAAEEFRAAAAAAEPDGGFALAHTNLGTALECQGRWEEAVAAHREAVRLKPDFAEAHTNLGNALRHVGRYAEAVAAHREAVRLKPDLAVAHTNLGVALMFQGETGPALAAFDEAVRLKPGMAVAHANRGNALRNLGRLDEAVAAQREALRLRPDLAVAHCNLGLALACQVRLGEAAAAFREALRLKPDFAVARGHLRLVEALAPSEGRLRAFVDGSARPANAAERVALAEFFYSYRWQFADAVRLYAEAFAERPALAGDLKHGHRYHAAAAAALGGVHAPDEATRARLRRQALDWLRDDLAAYRAVPAAARPAVARRLRQILTHGDYAGVREPAALARLPEAERPRWQALWADAAAVLAWTEQGTRPAP
jgi:tetratricopeptide (TPR) repeat protein